MAKRNRLTLKDFFKRGAMPSEHQFGDLIDSTLNLIDEGFDKSKEHGLEITPVRDGSSLLSFFRSERKQDPSWTMRFDLPRDTLLFERPSRDAEKDAPALALGTNGKVGVRTATPAFDLDVQGIVGARGRVGTFARDTVPADGDWHDITPHLSGCNAFEVVAGAGRKRSGNYALMHAFAINTYNPRGMFFNFLNLKKRIRYHQAYYRSLRSKLKLRWATRDDGYCLQLRSNGNYGAGYSVGFHITQLWFDQTMQDTQPPEESHR